MSELGTLGGSYSAAFGINDRGKVVGYAYTSNESRHAFVWRDGTMIDLNNLIPANSGWELTDARDINNNGQIVGHGEFNGQTRDFLLTPTWVSN